MGNHLPFCTTHHSNGCLPAWTSFFDQISLSHNPLFTICMYIPYKSNVYDCLRHCRWPIPKTKATISHIFTIPNEINAFGCQLPRQATSQRCTRWSWISKRRVKMCSARSQRCARSQQSRKLLHITKSCCKRCKDTPQIGKELGISPRYGDFNGDMMVINLEIVDNWELKKSVRRRHLKSLLSHSMVPKNVFWSPTKPWFLGYV